MDSFNTIPRMGTGLPSVSAQNQKHSSDVGKSGASILDASRTEL
jgi:hypothetical protein